MKLFYPDDKYRAWVYSTIEKNGNDFRDEEFVITCRDGKEKIISWSNISEAVPVPGWSSWAVGFDITGRKEVEEVYRRSLEEKEVLIKEIHHRVKNNMQVISSLINLTSMNAQNSELEEAFRDTRSRIVSMALVHEMLYQSENMAEVNLNSFIDNFSREIQRSYFHPTDKVTIEFSIRDVVVGIDQAVPCALIINEVVVNSLKHAFPGERSGNILIEGKTIENNRIELVIQDNGVGLPPDFDANNSDSIGFQIISGLVKQLKGEFSVDGKEGTRFLLRF